MCVCSVWVLAVGCARLVRDLCSVRVIRLPPPPPPPPWVRARGGVYALVAGFLAVGWARLVKDLFAVEILSLLPISVPTTLGRTRYAVFCLKQKN